MKIHTYLSSSGKDLIMEYINALTIEEQVDGLAVLAYMEKGEFEKVLSKRCGHYSYPLAYWHRILLRYSLFGWLIFLYKHRYIY